MSNGYEQLVAYDVAVGIVDALEIVEVENQDGAEPPVSNNSKIELGEPVVEQRPIGETRQWVVQRLVERWEVRARSSVTSRSENT